MKTLETTRPQNTEPQAREAVPESCCSTSEQATCCEPSAKSACCGPQTSETSKAPSSCGCR
jgi:hypothetical protein